MFKFLKISYEFAKFLNFQKFHFCTYLALNREKFNNYLTQSQSSAGGHLVYFM